MQCKARNKNGAPCAANAGASGYCFTHNPAMRAKRAAARKLGGKHRRRVVSNQPFPTVDTQTAQGLIAFLDALLRETWKLEPGIARSRTLAYIASVLKTVLEVGEIEERLSALEAEVQNANRDSSAS
jgi:hypothetical protein